MKKNAKVSVLYSAVTYLLQNMLNKFFYQELALKSIRARLIGQVLAIDLKEFSKPFIFIFSAEKVNVINKCSKSVDCRIKTALVTLTQLHNTQQLSTFINDGRIVIKGNIHIAQNFLAMFEATQWDLAHYFAPYVGDILAEGMSRFIKHLLTRINGLLNQQKNYFKDVLVEQLRILPHKLEVLSFFDKVENVAVAIKKLEQRLTKWEEKYESGRY
ncbi:MAG: SCP2 sterol-binding domain-containing protein [Candidatus Arsenophonus melophagi]|nr:SCP2 sterol-binding domain-containing protein [Candidatus Arsenophonus melophagi]